MITETFAARIIPVILCGGSGTRLWPASRESMPKQFLPLMGERSTFQETVARVSDPALFAQPIVIAGEPLRFTLGEQLAAVGAQAQIVLEPMARDSGPAVAVAAVIAAARAPEAVLLVLAADHVIRGTEAFASAIRDAAALAARGRIMTLGIEPSAASTEYGYIRPGATIEGAAREVAAFIEKPDAAAAERYVAEGCLWNSGNFLFRADVMIAEIERFEPAMLSAARAAVERMTEDLDWHRLDAAAFAQAPKKSIDYAVMERTSRAGVLPVSFFWSDIGTWSAVWNISEHDSSGNVTRGTVETIETRDSLIYGDGMLTTVVGLSDVVVVVSDDAVLLASKDQAHRVKQLVANLQRKQHRQAAEHRRVHRPWGWYQGVDAGPRFQVKRIMVKPGGVLSLQKHFHRAEHWVVVCGTAEVTVGDEVTLVQENESVYIPLGTVHRLANPGRIPLELIEVQVGSYTGEDDIVRLEDVYRR